MSDWFHKKEIGYQADKYARKTYVDEELAKAFQAGVEWTLDMFWRMLSVHPMEQGSTKALCNNFRLKDFQKLVEELNKQRSPESISDD